MTDALATLSAMLQVNRGKEMTIHVRQHTKMAHCQQVGEVEIDGKPWYHDDEEYLKRGIYPTKATENDKRTLRRLAIGFLLSRIILYKRSVDSTLLHCVDDCEAQEIMEKCMGEPSAPTLMATPSPAKSFKPDSTGPRWSQTVANM
ncbi:hypothetical protein CR513_43467, partial [Mucuna pruriens]